jgi:predicted secreted hydrolase
MEWWYLNATVSDNLGHQYTAMLAYFHPSLKIISIADLGAEIFYHEVPTIAKLIAAKPDYAEGGLDLRWNGYDRWYRTRKHIDLYSLQAKGTSIGFTFDLVQQKQPLMVGGDGLIDWTKGSTYYYSLTKLQVDGQIEIQRETYGMTWTLQETKHDIDLEIKTRFPQQEIILFQEMPQYTWQFWEGGTTISGQIDREPVSGIGYAELVPRILVPG